MGKGVLILIGTFVVVAILHLVSLKIMKISEAKKSYLRKLFWYFYGIILILSGSVNLVAKGEFYWSFSIQLLLGVIIIILNLLGKIEKKKPS